jgi:hypothetical protein
VIEGRIVDQEGRGVPDVTVTATAPAMGQVLWWAQSGTLRTRTAPDGGFALPVPAAGVLYELYCERLGYGYSPVTVIAGEGGPARVVMTREPHPSSLVSTLVDPYGKGIADVEVTIVGEYGFTRRVRSDRQGVVRFEELPQYMGQAVPVAKSGDLVLPLQIIRGGRLDLRLCPPGRVEGRLVDDPTGDPIRAATVTLRPAFMSGFALHATTDGDGRYTLEDVPPGVYHVEPSAPTHFDKPPRGQAFERPDVKVREAAATAASFRMKRVARVRGAVVDERGAPVAGAVVGMPCTWDGDYRDQNRYVLTDADGRFDIATGHAAAGDADRNDDAVHVAAFSSRHGRADVEVRPLAAGEVRDGVTLTLRGAARVRGTVASPAGKPVAGVQCVAGEANVTAYTDDRGRFDLGWLPLIKRKEDGRPALEFRAPRPPAGAMAPGAAIIVADPVAGHPQREADAWYQDATKPFDAAAGAEVDLNIALEPTDLLTFEGRVATPDGRPAAGARVFLFAGNAGADTWLDAAMPNVMSSTVVIIHDRLLTQGAADEQGNWRLRAVRADGEAAASGETRYSVGVVLPPRDGVLVRDVRLPAGASRRELVILVERAAADPQAGHLAPGPPAGAPAPETRQRENAERAGQK